MIIVILLRFSFEVFKSIDSCKLFALIKKLIWKKWNTSWLQWNLTLTDSKNFSKYSNWLQRNQTLVSPQIAKICYNFCKIYFVKTTKCIWQRLIIAKYVLLKICWGQTTLKNMASLRFSYVTNPDLQYWNIKKQVVFR